MKKLIPYILIFMVLVGLFSPALSSAQTNETICEVTDSSERPPTTFTKKGLTSSECAEYTGGSVRAVFTDSTGNATIVSKPKTPTGDKLYDELDNCGIGGVGGTMAGCIQVVTYFLFVTIPSFLMAMAALMFNFLAALTLSSDLYKLEFIQQIWAVVRDLANIFFILILIYAAFQIILNLGHGGGKKIVASVIVIALVVNFSLFFTKIVIDSSNILALIFYNRIDTTQTPNKPITSSTVSTVEPKDMAGALVSRFNVNTFFNGTLVDKIKKPDASYYEATTQATINLKADEKIGTGIVVSMMVVYGLVIYALAYSFFIVGMSFLGRMVSLIFLMIVSPLAFVTNAVPSFAGINTIGFKSWGHKLIETSFVAAVFMFILYIVSEVLRANIFGDVGNDDPLVATLIKIFMPAILIVMLLLKGTTYAKKASGEFTGAAINGAKMIGGLALGGVALGAAGAAAAGRGTAGNVAKYVQNDNARRKDFKTFGGYKDWSLGKKLNPFAYAGQTGKTIAAGAATLVHKTPLTGGKTLGERMQDQEKSFGKKLSSENKLNTKTDSEFGGKGKYDKGVKFNELTESEQIEVRKEIDKDLYAKQRFGTNFDGIKDDANREVVQNQVETAYKTYKAAPKGNKADLDAAEAQLKTDTAINKDASGDLIRHSGADEAIGEFVSSLRKGSYDVRNISQAPKIMKNTLGVVGAGAALLGAPIIGGGILASIAGGLRAGLKKGATEYGTVQKDFLKDLAGTINGALKNINIKVSVPGGGAKSGGSHGGGGGGHH